MRGVGEKDAVDVSANGCTLLVSCLFCFLIVFFSLYSVFFGGVGSEQWWTCTGSTKHVRTGSVWYFDNVGILAFVD